MMREPRDELLVQMAIALELLLGEVVASTQKTEPRVALTFAKQQGQLMGARDMLERAQGR